MVSRGTAARRSATVRALAELEYAAEAMHHPRRLLKAHDDAAVQIIYAQLPGRDELHERFD